MRDAGDRRLAERGAEKRHAPRDDEVAHAAEDRREHQHAEEAANEERILEIARQEPALRQAADPGVEAGHARALRRSPTAGSSSRTLAVARMSHRSFGDDPPIEDRDPIGDASHLLQIVRHHQDRRLPGPLRRRAASRRGCATADSSRPAVGSSSISSSGSGSSACASSTRRSSPPESTASGRRSRPAQADAVQQPGDGEPCVARVRPRQTGRRWRVSARKSATVTGRVGSTAKLCGT